MSIVQELKRRNVIKVAAAYSIVGWLLVEVASVVLPTFKAPEWIMQVFTFLVIMGLPLALIFAWAFEITPEGIKRDKDVDRSQSITHTTGRNIDYIIIAGLVLALGFFAFDKFVVGPSRDAELVQATTEAVTEQVTDSGNAETAEKSIAVLPFVNMSSDPEQEYFSDGIAEELLNVLVKVEGLRVASRTSSFAFKGKNISIPGIAKALNVDHVLEGSVRKAGNTVRITAQLIDVRTDSHLWSGTYDRELDNIFAIQDEIAQSVVSELKATLLTGEVLTLVGGTHDLQAYEHYLQGRHFWRRRNPDDLLRATQLLERAVEIDPDYADAWTALGAAYVVIPSYLDLDQEPYNDKAVTAARRALELDPLQAEAYAILANTYRDRNLWSEAVRNTEKAIELDPQNATAHHWAFITSISAGWLGDAHREIEKAYELDPLNAAIAGSLGWSHSVAGNYEKAIAMLETAKELGWGEYASLYIALNHALMGDTKTAAEIYASLGAIPGFAHFDWAPLFLNALQNPRQAKEFAQRIVELADDGQVPRPEASTMLALVGSEMIWGITDDNYIWAFWHRDTSAIRRTVAFRDLVTELKLVEYWRETGHWPDLCKPVGDNDFRCD